MERILGTLAGQPLDRRAFVPILSLYGAQLTKCPLPTYYTDPVAYARGQIAIHEQFEPDLLFGPFAFASIGAAFGSDVSLYNNQAPNLRRPGVPSVEDFDRLILPDPDTNPQLLYFREAIRRLVDECQGEVPVAACVPAPTDLPVLAMGMETWLETLLFDEAGTERVLEKSNALFVRFTNGLFAAGATVACLPCGFASPSVLLRNKVESLLRPALHAALGQLDGPAVLHHAGTSMLGHLDLLTGLPAVVGFALRSEEGLPAARRIVGPEPVLLSGLLGPSLVNLDAAFIERRCRELLEERREARDARFILATTGADVPLDTPPENIHAMRKALTSIGGDFS